MDASKLTYEILGRKSLGNYDSKILVNWAVKLIDHDYYSESLAILAGLDYEETDTREKYFRKAITELNIDIEKNESEIINFFVDSLTSDVLSGKVAPRQGLEVMCEVAIVTKYDQRYMEFYVLEDTICDIDEKGESMFVEGLNKQNVNNYIINEFRLFQKLQSGNYRQYKDKAICNNCGKIITPRRIKKYRLRKPFILYAFVCEFCNSKNIDTFSTQIGKEKIIAKLTLS